MQGRGRLPGSRASAVGWRMIIASDKRRSGSDGEDGRGRGLAGRGRAGRVAGTGGKCHENGHSNGVPANPHLARGVLPLQAPHAKPDIAPR
ncbi:hypothetical protein GCM10027440_32590 [Nocardiopsis coralliicola]